MKQLSIILVIALFVASCGQAPQKGEATEKVNENIQTDTDTSEMELSIDAAEKQSFKSAAKQSFRYGLGAENDSSYLFKQLEYASYFYMSQTALSELTDSIFPDSIFNSMPYGNMLWTTIEGVNGYTDVWLFSLEISKNPINAIRDMAISMDEEGNVDFMLDMMPLGATTTSQTFVLAIPQSSLIANQAEITLTYTYGGPGSKNKKKLSKSKEEPDDL